MTCPICESPDTALVWTCDGVPHHDGPHMDMYRCNDCGLGYRDPLPTQAELDHYYQHEYRPVPPDNAEFQKYSRAMADWRVSILSNRGTWREPFDGQPYDNEFTHALPQQDSVLDIGCADGAFLKQIGANGRYCRGIGLDSKEEWLHDSHTIITNDNIETWEPRYTESCDLCDASDTWVSRYTLITMFHVLEHLRDPVAILRKISEWVAPRWHHPDGAPWEGSVPGRIWLEVPDYDHPLRGDVTLEYTYPHLWIFTAKSLRLTMEAAGLTVCEVWNEVAPYTNRTCLMAIGRAV